MKDDQLIYLVELTGFNSITTYADILNVIKMAVGTLPQDLAYDIDGDGRVTKRDVHAFITGQAAIPVHPDTLYFSFSASGYMSRPTDTPPNQFYSPRISDPGIYQQAMFSQGTTGGKSTAAKGNIVLSNVDGQLDNLIEYGFGNQPCIVKSGYASQSLSEFATLITGTIEQVEFSWSQITLRLKDNAVLMDTPVQTIKYSGGNVLPDGIDGTIELKDKLQPRAFGRPWNITPDLVNGSKLIYRASDGAVFDIPAVHDGGNVGQILQGADYATPALLEAAAVLPLDPTLPPTGYVTCKAAGLMMLNQAPSFQLTCEVIQGANVAARTAGQIIKQLAGEKCGPENVVAQSIIDLDKTAPYELALYSHSGANTSAELDKLCNSVGAWWGFDNDGKFWAKQLTAPDATQAITTLTKDEIQSIERVATADGDRGVPVYKVAVEYGKNYTVQTSGLAGSVSDSLTFGSTTAPPDTPRQLELKTEYKRVTAIDESVLTLYPNAAEITIQTLLTNEADAQAVADQQLALRKVRRDRLKVTLKSQRVVYPAGGFWDNEAVAELPYAVSEYGVANYGSTIYLLGGKIGSIATATSLSLDTSAVKNSWIQTLPNLPVAVRMPSSCVVGSFLYAFGGKDSAGAFIDDYAYKINLNDIAAGWSVVSFTPTSYVSLTAGLRPRGIYIYTIIGVNSAYRFDTITELWEGIGTIPSLLNGVTCLVENYWYVFDTIGRDFKRINLDNIAGGWAELGTTPLDNIPFCVTYTNNHIYLITYPNKQAYRFNPFDTSVYYEKIANAPIGTNPMQAVKSGGSLFLTGSGTSTIDGTYRLRTNDNPDDIAQLNSLGRTILLKYPRYGYDTGRPMKIIGCDSNYRDGKLILELWG
ncbi:MAG: hypothetical protein H7Y05_12750 [Steroidobacteraceae bacterium]|nr:hypothetical protein [Deltaproteobacteria bacterium]